MEFLGSGCIVAYSSTGLGKGCRHSPGTVSNLKEASATMVEFATCRVDGGLRWFRPDNGTAIGP